ncbi:peptidoglycan DD-metalloendopeptidase family protein [Uliginosibacterium sp. 31-16]|uniref:murein hydrolase activator EnvC family protein n=1 Tax=Uliginosibacterium sp. 31-16 TaxID=3068315 RepID=UPI00273E8A85|nr:peptidoglycan DD-metalloendopeptidase family protein [Uliginosibacterium sp. 31-16]MDP5239772.1 peptidoglycan DD-metalloendopeptidase family protein [Uliginosibacterium sp. 31-16]
MVKRAALALFLAGACLLSIGAHAAPADSKRGELSALREKIRSLQDEVARSEENHVEAADELAASDKSISGAQRRLREISRLRDEAEADVERLTEQRLALENEIAILRKQLGDAVFRTYVEGGQAGTRRFLSGDNPNQLSRDAYYLEQIARQRIASIEQARVAMQALQDVLRAAEQRRAELVDLEKQRRREQENLLGERKKQREVLAQISSQLRSQRRQMANLQRDEARMEKIIKGLERITRSLPPKPSRNVSLPALSSAPVSPGRTEPGIGRADNVAGAESVELAFGERKGRLRWPVKGELTGRFGTQRAEGASAWRGVFIRAGNGAEVRAVAGGKVVFADWLRGFGNVVIIDHGDSYMTVYGNNEAIFKNPGDDAKTGEVIASVGVSGGLDESGLYFEIRHRGQVQDPVRWVAAK